MKKNFQKYILLFLFLLLCSQPMSAFNFDGGSGTASDPYQIHSVATFENFAKSVYDGTSYEGKYFKQTNDLVFNNGVIDKTNFTYNEAGKATFRNCVLAGRIYGLWTKNAFKGNYDGNNWTIWGLYFGDDMDEPYVGLFAYAENAIFQNLTIRESYMGCKATGTYNDNYHGFFVGLASNCTFINCHVVNSVIDINTKNELACGGLVGAIKGTNKMKECSFLGTINLQTQKDYIYVGGLIGRQALDYTMSNVLEACSTDGNININVDYSKSCEACLVGGLIPHSFQSEKIVSHLDMTECVNRINFNVYSLNFADWPDEQNGHDYSQMTGYSHMKELRIYQMCNGVDNMTNCANFGDVNIGQSNFRGHNDQNIDKKNYIGPIDNLVVAPVGYIKQSMNSCAFYGFTNVGLNGFDYETYEHGYHEEYYKKLFDLKVYTLAADQIYPDAKISRVLRREDGTSVPDEYNDKVPYLVDQNSVPNGVTLYATTNLENIIKDATKIIGDFSGYDDADKKTYQWGLLADGTFDGCPAPTVLGGQGTGLIGSGTMSDPYLIQNPNDYLIAVSAINTMNTTGKYYKLLADIDMSSTDAVDAFGTSDYPFRGTFMGNGHTIIGLNSKSGSMFGVVKGGSITNLTLLNMTCNGVDECFPLVNTLAVGDNTSRGLIDNCYVGGNIDVTFNASYTTSACYAAGLVGTSDGAIIRNSYFKGTFNLKGDSKKKMTAKVIGICKTISDESKSYTEIKNCFSIVKANWNDDLDKGYIFGVANNDLTQIPYLSIDNVYYMMDVYEISPFYGKQAKSYADIKVTAPFVEGVYNPVLPATKNYKLTDGRYLDAVVVDGEGTGDNANIILHYVPADGVDYKNDPNLWQHPNIAVYNADDDAEYLINCNLDNTKALQLNMDKAESQTIKANMHYPLNIYHNYYDRPLTKLLCLPVTIQRDALPEGSKLKIVGKKVLNADDKTFISTMVECDSVPAGVPFLAEIPADKTGSNKNATYDVVLRGVVAPEPVSTISVGDIKMDTELKGTYEGFTKKRTSAQYHKYREDCGVLVDGRYQVDDFANNISPFQAYAEVEEPSMGYTYNYYLIDNLLLDEESTDVTAMLNTYNGKTIGVVLKRSMKKDVWNTVCLPFDMSAEEIANTFGAGTIVEQLGHVENSATDGATIVFTTTSEMKAGKTYLVKPANSGSLYTLNDKEITNQVASEPEDATYDTYFKGTFAPTLLQGTAAQTNDGYSYNYFIQSNKLYYLPEGQAVSMKGFRGWILIKSNSLFGTDGNATNAKLIHYDGSATDVRAIEYGKTADGTRIYNLQGIEQSEMQKGINIVGGKKILK